MKKNLVFLSFIILSMLYNTNTSNAGCYLESCEDKGYCVANDENLALECKESGESNIKCKLPDNSPSEPKKSLSF